jgi:cytochrome c oxidase cbb3-type subunit 3
MNDTQPTPQSEAPLEGAVRPHVFDGIQEYDKRMPNWWLFTLYGSIVFAFGYWLFVEQFKAVPQGELALEQKMYANKMAAAQKSGELNDDVLWTMSRDPSVTAAGKATFETTCASCHRPDMLGMIGPNLRDQKWVHGGTPMTAIKVIHEGVLTKGMPPWAAVLGDRKITEVTAYIFSYHEKGEPVEIAPWVPNLAVPPTGTAQPAPPAPAEPAPAVVQPSS